MANKLIKFTIISEDLDQYSAIKKAWSDRINQFSNIERTYEANIYARNYYAYFNDSHLLLANPSSSLTYNFSMEFGTRQNTGRADTFSGLRESMQNFILNYAAGEITCEFIVNNETNALIVATGIRRNDVELLYPSGILLVNGGEYITSLSGVPGGCYLVSSNTPSVGMYIESAYTVGPPYGFSNYGYAATGDDDVYIRDAIMRTYPDNIGYLVGDDIKIIGGRQVSLPTLNGHGYGSAPKTIEVDDKKYMNLNGLWIGYDSEEEESVTV